MNNRDFEDFIDFPSYADIMRNQAPGHASQGWPGSVNITIGTVCISENNTNELLNKMQQEARREAKMMVIQSARPYLVS